MNPETPKELAQYLARDAEAVCRALLTDGKRDGNEWVALNPSRVDKNLGSFRILLVNGNKPAGFWKDFATDQSGDLLDLWCLVHSCDLGEAMRQARNFLGMAPPPILRKSTKTYAKPKRPPASKPAQTKSLVARYFSGRGITEETLKDFHILEQPNSWSNHPDNPADIVFPYLILQDGKLELFNNKYLAIKREADGKKITRLEKNARLGLFGWHLIKPDSRKVLITEGECFPGNAEILTPDGWVSFSDYQSGAVAQWCVDGKIEFVDPVARVEKPWNGLLIQRKWRGFHSETTPDHKIVSMDGRGRIYTHTAHDGPAGYGHKIPRCGIADGPGIPLTNQQLALCIAISADASIDQRNGQSPRNPPKEMRYARFAFKRQRKIDRLRKLLTECRIKCSDNAITNGCQSICLSIPDWVPGRFLPWNWIYQANAQQREFMIAELTHWDGNSVPNRNMTEYASKYFENASWVQTLAHTSGRCSSIVDRKNTYGEWFKVTILNDKKTSSWQNYKEHTRKIPYDGIVYCVQVPSGMLLVRQNRQITVTGNCDALTWHQIGAAVLSVPNGVSSGKKKPGEDENDWLEIEESRLARFDEIFISFDMDAPGREAAPRLIHRLGRHRCRLVKLPHKDANECLQQGMTAKDFAQCLRQAEYLRPEEFITFQEGIEVVKATRRQNAERGGIPEGMMLPWRKATKFWMIPSQLTVWTGYSGHGKTTLVSHVLMAAIPKGERICIASLEMTINDTVDRMCKQATGRTDLSDAELDKLGNLIEDRVVVYTHIGTSNLDTILEIFLYARRRHGCTQLVVDSLMMLGIGHDNYDAQVQAIQKLVAFAHEHHCHVHLIIHPKKPRDETEAPNMYDIKGSSGLVDNAPNVITVWRNKKKYDAQQDELLNGIPMDAKLISAPDTTMSIRKNRYNGWEATIPLWFREDSQQFLESPTEYPVVYLNPNAEENF